MQYRKMGKTGCEVSALGFGCMRLPTLDGEPGGEAIDEDAAIHMLRYAIDNGINYLDTAYVYHGRRGETVVGKALQDGYRDRTYLATKIPVRRVQQPEDFDAILDEQLMKLQTDHIDFYLLHAMDRELWEDKVIPYDLIDRMERAREAGKIRFLGFSFHDELSAFKEIVDGYDGWDFCQIQYNYINTHYQAGVEGLRYAADKGLGVVIMEPLLGGRLAVAPPQVRPVIPEGRSAVEWAFDYLWDQPEVSLLLSGMGSIDMVRQNIGYADCSYIGMVPEEERPLYGQAREIFDTMAIVPCTKCSYCMPCPFGVNIPQIYEAYNRTVSMGMRSARSFYDEIEGKADLCRACGHCERQCPQHIKSTELMPEIVKTFS